MVRPGVGLRSFLLTVLLALGITPATVLLLSFLPGVMSAYDDVARQSGLIQAQTQASELTQRLERRLETVRNIAMLPAPLEMLKAVEGEGGGLYLNTQQAAERFAGVIRRWFNPVGDLRALAILDPSGVERLRLEAMADGVVSVPPSTRPRHGMGDRFPRILASKSPDPQAFVVDESLRLRIGMPIRALDGHVAGMALMDFDLRDILDDYRDSVWMDGRGKWIHGEQDESGIVPNLVHQASIAVDAHGHEIAWVPLTLGPEEEDVLWVGTRVDLTAPRERLIEIVGGALIVFFVLALIIGLSVDHLVKRLDAAKQKLVEGLHSLLEGRPGVRFSWSGPAEVRALGDELTQLGEVHADTVRSLHLTGFSVDHAGESIFWIAADGHVFYVNEAACALAGRPREEMEGLHVGGLNPAYVPARWEEHWQALVEAGRRRFEAEIVRPDGVVIPVEVSANLLEFEGRQYDLAFIRNITERRAAQARLQATVDELTRSNVELERFAHVAAHDLQEPVRTVVSFAQLVERKAGDTLTGEVREYLDYLVAGAKRMQDLVMDLLAYSRVRHGDTPPSLVPLGDALAAAVANLQALVVERRAHIVTRKLPVVRGDMVQLVEVFQNLIANAIKFSRADATPEIHVTAEHRDGEWEISVADNGVGIAPEYHDAVFEIFTRLHGAHYPGTGIGLALCRRIVERHGGRIWVRSAPGEGTTIHFTFPDLG